MVDGVTISGGSICWMNMVSASRMKQETILLTVRPLDEKGKWQYKTEKEYLCVKGGEERGFTAAEFKQA